MFELYTSNRYRPESATEPDHQTVEYRQFGQQMVRELESFLDAELARPHFGRCIGFMTARALIPSPGIPGEG